MKRDYKNPVYICAQQVSGDAMLSDSKCYLDEKLCDEEVKQWHDKGCTWMKKFTLYPVLKD